MYSFDKPDLNINTLLVFIGHEELCEIEDGSHKRVTALGKAWSNSGIASIHNNGTELSERKTILHDIMGNLIICQACQNLIRANCFKFDHE